eukprot:g1408.t1
MDDEGVYHNKRLRMSPPLTPNIDDENDLDVMSAAGRESRAVSDASSDWGDWADRQVAQGEASGDVVIEAAGGGSAVDGSGKDDEDDQWVRKQMEQPSAVLAADNRAWDYVLQMVVDEGEEAALGAATVAAPVQEVRGAAATEFVSRWLRCNLPIALPSLNALDLTSRQSHPGSVSVSGSGGGAVVDSVANPSAVAVVSCSPEQSMHRINLFSLTANAGSALAAALVQPGAAGLLATAAREPREKPHESEDYTGGGVASCGEVLVERMCGAEGQTKRGVVFESLDSRIHMDSLASAMGRLGLGVKHRTRSGLWRIRPGVVLLPPAESNAKVTPLTFEDASLVSRSYGVQPGGAPSTSKGICGAEALVRGLIRRNPSAGIRRGNQLVAWCLSFDNGLAGGLHVVKAPPPSPPHPSLEGVERGEEREGLSPQNLVLALLASLLVQPADPELKAVGDTSGRNSLGAEGERARVSTAQHQPDVLDVSAQRRAGPAAVVIDDESPFVGLFEELGLLERVCDADWVRFEIFDHRGGNGSSSRAPAAMDDRDESTGVGAGGPIELPLALLMMQP